jgi:protein TonB
MDPTDPTPFGAAVRTIVVPPDIVAVKRTSPVRVKRHTPWRDRPAGHAIERAGGREWLSDHGSVEPRAPRRAAYGTSITAHLSGVLVLVAGLVAAPDHLPAVRLTPALVMPVMLSMLPATPQASPGPPPSDRRLPRESRSGAPPRPAEPATEIAQPAPLEAPPAIRPETGAEGNHDLVGDGAAREAGGDGKGTDDRGNGDGTAGGGGTGGSGSGNGEPGPVRVGPGIDPPRKIKDVKPVYPAGALADRTHGTVIVHATIGIDGKVRNVAVVSSIPALDRAAIDAVRLWEFTPARMQGVPVAVIVTIVVNFAIF